MPAVTKLLRKLLLGRSPIADEQCRPAFRGQAGHDFVVTGAQTTLSCHVGGRSILVRDGGRSNRDDAAALVGVLHGVGGTRAAALLRNNILRCLVLVVSPSTPQEQRIGFLVEAACGMAQMPNQVFDTTAV